MHNIYNEIVREMKKHTNKTVDAAVSHLGFELGTITNNGSLKLDNFKYEIGDYRVLEYLKMDSVIFSKTTDELHTVATPNQLRPLANGDRVLVASVSESDFVVVGRIANA